MVIGIIPTRMASSRFPGKPLAKILGVPMIGHVYFRSLMSEKLDRVYVATCDKEIFDYSSSIDADAIMTSASHQRASDRTAEAMLKIEKKLKVKVNSVVMIQGDEPMIFPEMIDLSLGPLLKSRSINITNLMAEVKTKEEQLDPNTVKVVVDKNNFALYYSRETIPSSKKYNKQFPVYKQVPIIPFRRDFLIKFGKLAPTALEIIESVDMLRVLEHGYKVKMVLSKFDTFSVDTAQDLAKVEQLMKRDPLVKKYSINLQKGRVL